MMARELTKPALESVTVHRGMLEARYDETDSGRDMRGVPRKRERGTRDADLEVRGPKAFPLSCNALELCTARYPCPTREAE